MRLLNVNTFKFEEFEGKKIPRYAIASHRWCADEATYVDVLENKNTQTEGFKKIQGFCAFTKSRNSYEGRRRDGPFTGLKYIWIDTCCIDRRNSAEISENITSMYRYYERAAECYAYLSDLSDGPYASRRRNPISDEFENSQWFTRGWTLQELLAPSQVVFISSNWKVFGFKRRGNEASPAADINVLNFGISGITGIPQDVLAKRRDPKQLPPEQICEWIKQRETKKEEDLAYCLLGLFGVYLIPNYGEGDNAWSRLEKEVSEKRKQPVSLPRPIQLLPEEEQDDSSLFRGRSRSPIYPASPIKISQSPGFFSKLPYRLGLRRGNGRGYSRDRHASDDDFTDSDSERAVRRRPIGYPRRHRTDRREEVESDINIVPYSDSESEMRRRPIGYPRRHKIDRRVQEQSDTIVIEENKRKQDEEMQEHIDRKLAALGYSSKALAEESEKLEKEQQEKSILKRRTERAKLEKDRQDKLERERLLDAARREMERNRTATNRQATLEPEGADPSATQQRRKQEEEIAEARRLRQLERDLIRRQQDENDAAHRRLHHRRSSGAMAVYGDDEETVARPQLTDRPSSVPIVHFATPPASSDSPEPRRHHHKSKSKPQVVILADPKATPSHEDLPDGARRYVTVRN